MIDGLVQKFPSSTFQIRFEVETAGNCLIPQGDLDDLIATASNVGISFFPQFVKKRSHNSNQFHEAKLWEEQYFAALGVSLTL